MSNLVFQTAWNEEYCKGPPSTIILFLDSNSTDIFTNQQNDQPYPNCGFSEFDIPAGCCITSLNTAQTYYSSYEMHYIENTDIQESLVSLANGIQFCNVRSASDLSLWGYSQYFYRSNGNCMDGNVKCSQDYLRVYEDGNCQNITEEFPISSTSTNISSRLFGTVEIQLVEITNGKVGIQFYTYFPDAEFIINHTESIDYCITASFIISGLVVFATLSKYLKEYLVFKRVRYFYFSLVQMFWILRTLSYCLNFYLVLTDQTAYAVVNMIAVILKFTTVFPILLNVNLILEIYKEYNTVTIRAVSYFLVILVHFLLNGLSYISYVMIVNGNYSFGPYLNNIAQNPLVVWSLLQYMLDSGPQIVLTIRLSTQWKAKAKVYDSTIRNFMEQTLKTIKILLCLLVFNATVASILEVLKNTTNIYGSDRGYCLLYALISLFNALHSVLILQIYEQMVEFTLSMVTKGKSLQKKLTKGRQKEQDKPKVVENRQVKESADGLHSHQTNSQEKSTIPMLNY
ncbi:hypothetical protein HDV06_003755 [Boothiomyces sp. JEL0866]|nr:hypothetical protein HDV06_003755 [Boothiomyces sp. JEL0866]